MSGTLQPFTIPSNNIALPVNLQAISTLSAYPIATVRKDMTARELTSYRYEWATFDRIWVYNYTVSTLNGASEKKGYIPYQFESKNEQLAYRNGQISHIAYYSTAGAAGQFDNIPF